MNPTSTASTPRALGSTGLQVTPVAFGTSPLASMSNLYGYAVAEERAVATVRAVFDSPVTLLDTSNGYGEDGSAERRIGIAVREAGGLPPGLVLSTKVDPDKRTGDFSGERVRRSLEESLERLGVDRVPLLHLHDPERMEFADAIKPGGAVPALVELRERGLVDHLGVAGGPVGVLRDYLGTGEFEVVLSHNRATLLDRSVLPLFAEAAERGIGVLNAAPYGGGMLSKGPEAQPKYAYGTRGDEVADAARRMGDVCTRAGVPLAAAALQFSLRLPSVHSTVIGVSSPERVAQTLELAAVEVPDDVWDELERLVPDPAGWLG
ncbi:aldo/keto reductase [Microlunatus flavus]|uniref:D-threo-aldose 1-dehydrogenase n=1 Tax=Microlunatus flavus TaxID=1036181 RepID=A0A1H8Z0A0_9ACTN|nr:aldo/keto reductase [Microlunatus flavus]SEP57949.1 D-threo-aldose 1-dehydrogenase [Microlunatus flavus]